VPTEVVTNVDLAKLVERSDEWIRTRTGIGERRRLEAGEATSDMAVRAAEQALAAAGVPPQDVDVIMVATITPDLPMPACAVLVQEKLGARCPAFDISAACAGFSYGLTLADSLIRAGTYKRVLFVGAETLSRVTNWQDRTTCILFGDGAGAVLLEAHDTPPGAAPARGILATHLGCDGTLAKELMIPAGGSAVPASSATVAGGQHAIFMNGRAIFSNAVRSMSESAEQVLAAAKVGVEDVDFVIPHQANMRIIEAIAKRLAVPMDKVLVNIERFGNTSSASIPIVLDEAVRDGRIRTGDLVLMTGLGGGLAWGAALVRW